MAAGAAPLLVPLLGAGNSPAAQANAAAALHSLARGSITNITAILSARGMVDALLRLLDSPDQAVQLQAALALASLAAGRRSLRAAVQTAIPVLVQHLSDTVHVQQQAAAALANLADPGSRTAFAAAGAVAALLTQLRESRSLRVQKQAARALSKLAHPSNACFGDVTPAAINLLVERLGSSSLDVRQYAAAALRYLVSQVTRSATKQQAEDVKAALQSSISVLVQQLSRRSNPTLQEQAAGALRNLANGLSEFRQEIGGVDYAMPALLELLRSAGSTIGAQEQAAGTLCSLACNDGVVDEGAVPVLKAALRHRSPVVRCFARQALGCMGVITN